MKKRILLVLLSLSLPAWWASAQDAVPSCKEMTLDNVVIILDASGSMNTVMGGQRRMDAAKQAIALLVDMIPSSTHLGLLVFSGQFGNPVTPIREPWLFPLGPMDKAKFIQGVNVPIPGGMTPLGQYMKVGADALLAKRAKQGGYGTYRLLVVTDGQASDRSVMLSVMPKILVRGIKVDVIGVDMKGDHELATRAHSYRRANDPKALQQAVSQVFAEVSGQAADKESQEAFELISWLSDDAVTRILAALNNNQNQPIGEAPK